MILNVRLISTELNSSTLWLFVSLIYVFVLLFSFFLQYSPFDISYFGSSSDAIQANCLMNNASIA